MENKYVIAVLVSNISGVLSRVSGMFTRRGFNIDSLTVGETESSGFSRITISFHGDDDIKERILQQLQKLHDVREVEVLNANEEKELVEKFNAAIDAIRATGKYKEINDKYFSFDVYGAGHRVGLSQCGAQAMALAGATAEQILTTYYTGVEISHI